MSNKSENKPLQFFNFISGDKHYFEELNGTFWDSDNIISKKYKLIKNNENINKNKLEKAYKTLLNYKQKEIYFRYLMIEYTLSQPNNLNQLKENYYSIIFPYYLFLLRNEVNEDLNYLIIDNINFSINIYEKNSLKNSFEIDGILDINYKLNCIEISIVNSKENVQIIPYIIQHNELIYTLIIYMVTISKKKENWKKELKKVNEINQNLKKSDIKTIDQIDIGKNYIFNTIDISQFKILSNDSFVPKGIIESINVSLEYKKNTPDYFLLLGRRYIYLFKNDSLSELNIIIPLSPGFNIFELEEIYQKIRIKAGNKDYTFFIGEKDAYSQFRDKLIDILEGNKDDIFDKDDIFKCSIAFYNDKIMGGVFENTPSYEKNKKDFENLNHKLNELKNIKKEIEKESIENETIRKMIQEEENQII